MNNKDILEKISHDIESSLSQIEFVFHQKNVSPADVREFENIFTVAVNRIRASNGDLKEICLQGVVNEKIG